MPNPSDESQPAKQPAIQRGLAGVYFDTTAICHLDGVSGKLFYRGRELGELLPTLGVIDLAYLLVEGRAPTDAERAADAHAVKSIAMPQYGWQPHFCFRAIDILRAALGQSETAGDTPASGRDLTASHTLRVVARITAVLTDMIHRLATDQHHPVYDRFVATIQSAMTGVDSGASAAHVRALTRAIAVLAEHSSNASAFAARVATSTGAPPAAALIAAACTFEGPLHGGAIKQCTGAIDAIGDPKNVAAWMKSRRDQNLYIPGFGHRVYRTEDPRVALLRGEVMALLGGKESTACQIADELVSQMQPMRRLGLAPNVDLYAAVLFRELSAPPDFAIPIFSLARTIGWCAHIREQAHQNILIRPLLHYRPDSH
jgi:citrate synthase